MDNLRKELKLIINKELYQKELINFEEFKMMNEEIMKETNDEYSSNKK